jgi:predicted ATPase
LPSCFCTYSSIDVEIARDIQLVQHHAQSAAAAVSNAANCTAYRYISIPESKAVADLLAACWASRQRSSSGILLHGPVGCGKTACIKHVLSERKIQHEYFDCAAMYEQEGSLFTEAVRSVARCSKREAALDGSDHGAVLVLDHLECMFPPLTSHTQVRVFVAPPAHRVTTWFAAS